MSILWNYGKKMLRPKDDFVSRGIVFSEIENYYDDYRGTYTIPYNPETRQFQDLEFQNLREYPKDLIAIKFPSERMLDTVGWNRKYGYEPSEGIGRIGVKLQYTARKIPWENTILKDIIKMNRRYDQHRKEQQLKDKSKNHTNNQIKNQRRMRM